MLVNFILDVWWLLWGIYMGKGLCVRGWGFGIGLLGIVMGICGLWRGFLGGLGWRIGGRSRGRV